MLNYYKRNYPREPYVEDSSPVTVDPVVKTIFCHQFANVRRV